MIEKIMVSLPESSLERAVRDLAEAQADMERCRLRIEKLQIVIEYLSGDGLSQSVSAPSSDTDRNNGLRFLSKNSPLFGKSLAQAAIYALGQLGVPSTDVEIASYLTNLGWKFSGNKSAATNVYWALREHSIKHSEVISEPGSKWRLASWSKESERSAKSRLGLKVARANGVVLGPRPKMNAEMQDRLKALLDQGTSVAVAARELKISAPTIYRFIRRTTEPRADLIDVARSTLIEGDKMPDDDE